MITPIVVVLIGLGGLVVIGAVVGVLDAAQARAWRQVAAERRRNWEVRQAGTSRSGYDSWGDEDSD
ncbi:hypothetical protein LWC33_03410 [Pseudonocardia sp. RS11V-5]|uniref:hypothetical protein n=1 Tax=Pseudonocardia terrae TaxID=2905831 RepID=UPI001E605562|nr:hypothetical protein [Pseudonocardia terrae]MCE3550498.1 hypothetical protein [Pseudonocardia terrae]